jgi:transcription elongation factor GreA
MSIDQETTSLSQAVANYLATLKIEQRGTAGPELSKFTRWYGAERPIRQIFPGDVERYQEQVAQNGGDPNKLEPLRAFFSYARQKKLIDHSLAVAVRIRRKAVGSSIVNEAPVRQTVEITQNGYDQLVAELNHLENVEQPHAREELQRAAADKDFRENAPYDAAKEKLAELQRRVNEIRETLGAAVIVGENTSNERAGLGTTVIIWDLDEDEELVYKLVGPGEIDARNGRISIQSPVGRALSDRRIGDIVQVETPAGVARYRVDKITR